MSRFSLSRRQLFHTAAAAGVASLANTASDALGETVAQATPGWVRFAIGDFEAFVVSDGPLAQGDPVAVLKGHTPDEIRTVLRENFLNESNLTLDQNALVLRRGGRIVLFDTGTGGARLFGAKPGKLVDNLKASGLDPQSITDVILSHAHPDHIWGLSTEDGTQNFPNAQVHLSVEDHRFFTEEANDQHPLLGQFMPACRAEIAAVKDRLNLLQDGQEVLPGITAMAAPGHTPGHTIFAIHSGNDSLVFIGDLAHHHVIFTRYPDIQFGFDTDPLEMVQTRTRYFDMLATDRLKLVGYHFPFPGAGHLKKAAQGYDWVPASLDTL